jgi:hypothetical protein
MAIAEGHVKGNLHEVMKISRRMNTGRYCVKGERLRVGHRFGAHDFVEFFFGEVAEFQCGLS